MGPLAPKPGLVGVCCSLVGVGLGFGPHWCETLGENVVPACLELGTVCKRGVDQPGPTLPEVTYQGGR